MHFVCGIVWPVLLWFDMYLSQSARGICWWYVKLLCFIFEKFEKSYEVLDNWMKAFPKFKERKVGKCQNGHSSVVTWGDSRADLKEIPCKHLKNIAIIIIIITVLFGLDVMRNIWIHSWFENKQYLLVIPHQVGSEV